MKSLSLHKGAFTSLTIFRFIDRVSTGGNAIVSVRRRSVFTLPLEPIDLLTLTFCMCMGHDHSSRTVEDQGQRSRLGSQFEMRSVGPRSSIDEFSSLN